MAICLSPGTELSFSKEVRRESVWWPFTKLKCKTAIFRQVNSNPRTHHDALEFPDGQIVLLTFLQEGQKATVLQLPASADAKAEQRVERVNSQLSLTVASAIGV